MGREKHISLRTETCSQNQPKTNTKPENFANAPTWVNFSQSLPPPPPPLLIGKLLRFEIIDRMRQFKSDHYHRSRLQCTAQLRTRPLPFPSLHSTPPHPLNLVSTVCNQPPITSNRRFEFYCSPGHLHRFRMLLNSHISAVDYPQFPAEKYQHRNCCSLATHRQFR